MPPVEYTLRPALASDRPFLYAVFRHTMRSTIERTWGWDDAWQEAEFDRRFDVCTVSVVESGGTAAGVLWLDTGPTHLHVEGIYLLPPWQSRGLGTRLLSEIIAQGTDRRVPVTLAVSPANGRARRLYERLGFRASHTAPHLIHMRYSPADPVAASGD